MNSPLNYCNQRKYTQGLFLNACQNVASAVLELVKKTGKNSREVLGPAADASLMKSMYLTASKEDYEILKAKFYELRNLIFKPALCLM